MHIILAFYREGFFEDTMFLEPFQVVGTPGGR
jgi:hypothetical protein